MLSRVAVDAIASAAPPRLRLVYRDPTTITRIPNYEGQPMVQTLFEQIAAAGGVVVDNTTVWTCNDTQEEVVLLVNNFSEQTQLEVPSASFIASHVLRHTHCSHCSLLCMNPIAQSTNQPVSGSTSEYSMFNPYIECASASGGYPIIGFADNRYSNGGDNWLGNFIMQWAAQTPHPLDLGVTAYSGWNTDGNTLGVAVQNLSCICFCVLTLRPLVCCRRHCDFQLHFAVAVPLQTAKLDVCVTAHT
jgi:hypothetical protein